MELEKFLIKNYKNYWWNFSLTPFGIIKALDLKTAFYGHFGREGNLIN